MKGPSKTPDSKTARRTFGHAALRAARGAVLLALGGCGAAKSGTPVPTVVDRQELPAVRVAPADGGASTAPAPRGPAPPEFPRTSALGALAEGDRIADLAVWGGADRYLLAWVTYFDGGLPVSAPAPRAAGKKAAPAPAPAQAKVGATVSVRAIDLEGEALGAANVISVKAESIGGVSLAPGVTPQGDTGLAWVGKDAGIGQVFVTRVSKNGEKQAQRMVTRSKEGCSDVALVRYRDGFVVAYVDSRDHKVGIYVTKVGKSLEPMAGERLVARAQGEASDVRMLARGDELVVAWAEARRNPEAYGVFTARLLAADLSVRGDPTRVVLTPQHAKGVELSPFGDGVALGWIEDAAPAQAAAPAAEKTVALTRLDPQLRASGEPIRVALPGRASSLTFECERSCRVVVAGAEGDDLTFYGFFFEGAAPSSAARLASLPGVSTEDTNPVMSRDWLFFAEDNLHGAGRIRKAKVVWR